MAEWFQRRKWSFTSTPLYDGAILPAVTDFDGLVIMGGPMSVHDEKVLPWMTGEKRLIEEAIRTGKAVLGICLGAQLIASVLGARVYRNREKEIGWYSIERKADPATVPLAERWPLRQDVFHWHGETFDIPAGAIHLASSAACVNQAFLYNDRVLALQFHLETTPTDARQLIEHGREEMIPAPFIQTEEEILSDKNRFHHINRMMEEIILPYLAEQATTP